MAKPKKLPKRGVRLLRRELVKRKLTLRAAAAESGVTDHARFHHWLHAVRVPSVEDAVKLKQAFGVPVEAWTQDDIRTGTDG